MNSGMPVELTGSGMSVAAASESSETSSSCTSASASSVANAHEPSNSVAGLAAAAWWARKTGKVSLS
ncbi:hypothetical protein CLOM_g20317 [Closterium sp. NIES-68]|nr:hypothetical protein CLOM_g20317 [Closterium sp. NIES-68]